MNKTNKKNGFFFYSGIVPIPLFINANCSAYIHIYLSSSNRSATKLPPGAIQIHHLKPLSSIIIFCMALRLFVLIDKKKNAIDLLLQR